MPDWLCLEDECEFEKDPVKLIGLSSLLLLAKSLLRAPLLSFPKVVAMLKKEKFMVCVLFLNTGQAFLSALSSKRKKQAPQNLNISREKQNLRQVSVRVLGLFPALMLGVYR